MLEENQKVRLKLSKLWQSMWRTVCEQVRNAGDEIKMDKCNSWKKTEDFEIDLADLLKKLCRKWKRIAASAAAAALILGGYGWMKDQAAQGLETKEAVQESELTETEEQAVADAVQMEQEIRELEKYLDSSVLMSIDPYHKSKTVMLYSIDHARRQEMPVIMESYLNYITNGGAADALESSWKIDKSCMAELVSAYQKTYSFPYLAAMDVQEAGSQMSESLFYVEITGENAEVAEKMAQDLQKVIESYSVEIKKTAGSHRLRLAGSMGSVTADGGLAAQQHDKKMLLSSNRTNLKAMKDAFSEAQMAAYRQESGIEEHEADEETEETVGKGNFGFVMKYVFLGFAAGAAIYCCIFAGQYIFDDTVKSAQEMKMMYSFPYYGDIPLEDRKKESGVSKSGQVLNRIRLSCHRQGITKLCAVSDFSLSVKEKECLENMVQKLRDNGIEMNFTENAVSDTDMWDSLSETGNVLMVCRLGTTTRRMIDDAMNFYMDNGIVVTGAAAFLNK